MRAMRESELIFDSVLVRIDRLAADAKLARDLGAAVALGDHAENGLLAVAERLEAPARRLGGALWDDGGCEHASGSRAHVDLAAGDDSDCLDEITRRRVLREIPARAGLEELHETLLFGMHRENEDAHLRRCPL